jgi:hypothetical protein
MKSELLKNWGPSTDKEMRARTIITELLEAVYKELRLEGFAGPDEIRMREETTFTFYPMKYMVGRKPRKFRCVGRTDLSFNFGDEEAQAINLVVVDVNHSRASHGGQGQILAYMAMVWAERKRRKQSDCTVYGCLTDSVDFYFFRVAHDGTWSKVPIFVPLYPCFQDGMNVVANFFASFLKHGLETSLHSSHSTMR